MKKIRKGRLILIILLALIVISVATVIIMNIVNKQPQKPQEPKEPEVQQVITLPKTTYSNMEVKNITVEYMKNNNQTKLSMEIDNTTDRNVEDEYFTVVLIDSNEKTLDQMRTWIQKLDVGEQHEFEVILEGDLTATKQIKLIEE